MLAVIKSLSRGSFGGTEGFGRNTAIDGAARQIGALDARTSRRVMDAWDDLYRAGIVGTGMDLANLGGQWVHV